MQNFHLHFSHPWLLLLFIPAIALTLIPYFRLSKRYRRTRNRIVSIVLHLLVMTLAISVLAGLEFRYEIPNEKNEIIILVDKSDSEEAVQTTRDEFVKTVIDDSKFDNYNVGVVTFGFNQVYAVPMTDEVGGIYEKYLNAPLPDVSATNVAAALDYAKDLFTHPETGKIVLVTDGKETDEVALSVIRSVAARGITVDTAYVESEYESDDVQIVEVALPDYHVGLNQACEIVVTLKSQYQTETSLSLYDNGELVETIQPVSVQPGAQSSTFTHKFETEGLHKLYFQIDLSDDGLQQNNEYYTYFYLEQFNNVLILEHVSGESEDLSKFMNEGLSDEEQYDITVKCVSDDMFSAINQEVEQLSKANKFASEQEKKTYIKERVLNELRAYDQIILNNISNLDLTSVAMPKGAAENFDEILKIYVEEFGGGLFTVGGDSEDGEANTYKRNDMYGTLYQELLPVQAINYTPPVGVMIIIDRSGSMTGIDDYGNSFLEGAKAGALACLEVLSERDYIGVMTLDTYYNLVLEMTPTTQYSKIRNAIDTIEEANGNTVFADALNRAGQILGQLKTVDKRHMIIVTDGAPADTGDYEEFIKQYYEQDGTTLSIVGIGMSENSANAKKMKEDVALTNNPEGFYAVKNTKQLVTEMSEDLKAPLITEVNEEPFNPTVYNAASSLVQGLDRMENYKNKLDVELGGFYGVKVRDAADLVLVGEYDVPIYAQWKYGEGMVGSFMCDLQDSDWSSDFMSSEIGQTFIRNVINNLMPTTSIRPSEISYKLKEDNYTNGLSVYANLAEGETVKGELEQLPTDGSTGVVVDLGKVSTPTPESICYVKVALDASNNYSRCDFIVKKGGVYRLTLTKFDKSGKELASTTVYKAFAYSEEYDVFLEQTSDELKASVEELATKGNGTFIEDLEDPFEIFKNFVTATKRSYDPRTLFMILAIVFFLTDIAVRKFKFLWPHEIVRRYKDKKSRK